MGNHQSAMLAIDERSANRRKIVLSVALLAAIAVLIGGAFATFTNTTAWSAGDHLGHRQTGDRPDERRGHRGEQHRRRRHDLARGRPQLDRRHAREQRNHAEILSFAVVAARHRSHERAAGQHPGVLGGVETHGRGITASAFTYECTGTTSAVKMSGCGNQLGQRAGDHARETRRTENPWGRRSGLPGLQGRTPGGGAPATSRKWRRARAHPAAPPRPRTCRAALRP